MSTLRSNSALLRTASAIPAAAFLLGLMLCGLPGAAQTSASDSESHDCTDYYYGVGVAQSFTKAFHCFQEPDKSGNHAVWQILMTLNGEGTAQSLKNASLILARLTQENQQGEVGGILDAICCDDETLKEIDRTIDEREKDPTQMRSRLRWCDFTLGTNNFAICLDDFAGIMQAKHQAELKRIEAKLSPAESASLGEIKTILKDFIKADGEWRLAENIMGKGRATFASRQEIIDDGDFATLVRKVVRDHGLKPRSEREFQAKDKELNAAYQLEITGENGGKSDYFESARAAERLWLKLDEAWKKLAEDLYRGEMPAAEIDRAIATELRERRIQEFDEENRPEVFAAEIPELEHVDRGYRLLQGQDWNGAIGEYREVIRLNPDNGVAHSALGWALESNKDWEAAIVAYREAIRVNPEDAAAHHGLGACLASKQDRDRAIREYRQAVTKAPLWEKARTDLISALTDSGDWEGAIAEYREAIHRKPDDAGLHAGLGWAFERKSDWGSSERENREAIQLSPNWADVHNNLADALHGKGDWDGAIAEAGEALRLDPKLAGAHVNIGNALHAKGDTAGAIAEFREAIRLKPDYATAHNNLGYLLENTGNWDGAAAEYREAIRTWPDYPHAHYGLGQVLEHQGFDRDALEQYRRASQLLPDSQEVRGAYERLLNKLGP